MVQELGVSHQLNDVLKNAIYFFVACPATEKTAGFSNITAATG